MKLEILADVPTRNANVPPLLFVHGAWHGAWCWKEHFLPYFSSQGFSCYALSLRGHGESEGMERIHSFSLSDYVDDVLEVMEQLKEKPVLIGHSMGGEIVQRVVHAYPDKVKAVILLASAPPQGITLPERLLLLLTHVREMFQINLFNQRKSLQFPVQLFFSKNLTVEEKDKFTKLLRPESHMVLRDLGKRFLPAPTWSSPQVPMLVLGAKKDAISSEKTVKSIGKVYKTQPIIFPDIGHDMMLDSEWRRVADVMHTFLCETVFSEDN
jgi:pimeloyl-ACP methyl ester carboxylesterase